MAVLYGSHEAFEALGERGRGPNHFWIPAEEHVYKARTDRKSITQAFLPQHATLGQVECHLCTLLCGPRPVRRSQATASQMGETANDETAVVMTLSMTALQCCRAL